MKWAKSGLACFVLSGSSFLLSNPSRADPVSDPVVPTLPAPSVEWVAGPANVKLSTVAEFSIPQGYKFADAKTGQAVLERMNTPVPKGLLGLLARDGDEGYVLLEFAQLGFVKDANQALLDADAILKQLRTQLENQLSGGPKSAPAPALSWELEPVYTPAGHSIEWAIRSGTGSNEVVHHTLRLLGRHGVLDLTLAGAAGSSREPVSLVQIAKGLVFREGEGYSEHQSGDDPCRAGLAELIVSKSAAQFAKSTPSDVTGGSTRSLATLAIGAVLLVCGLATGGILLMKKRSRHQHTSSNQMPAAATPGPTAAATETSPMPPVSVKPRVQTSLGGLKHKTEFPSKGPNGKTHYRGVRRKRVFDYNRYFIDLMSAVSASNHMESTAVNGHSTELEQLPPGGTPPSPTTPVAGKVLEAHSEMISHQKNLIEEQKRLIQEQTRLIEEKSKLIAEKNQLLKMQAEWIDSKLL